MEIFIFIIDYAIIEKNRKVFMENSPTNKLKKCCLPPPCGVFI